MEETYLSSFCFQRGLLLPAQGSSLEGKLLTDPPPGLASLQSRLTSPGDLKPHSLCSTHTPDSEDPVV